MTATLGCHLTSQLDHVSSGLRPAHLQPGEHVTYELTIRNAEQVPLLVTGLSYHVAWLDGKPRQEPS